jgi:hypothetical protein
MNIDDVNNLNQSNSIDSVIKEERENKRQIAAALADAEESPEGHNSGLNKMISSQISRKLMGELHRTPTKIVSRMGSTNVSKPITPEPR